MNNREKRCGLGFLQRLVFMALFLLAGTLSAWAHDNRNIFVLHSYHQEYPWTKKQHEGFVETMEASCVSSLHISTEYLDTKINRFDEAYQTFFLAYLKRKYRNFIPDAIYVTDDNALQFIHQFESELFPSSKVFFSGVNDIAFVETLDKSRYTGTIEKKSLKENIDLIKVFRPRTKEVLVVGDDSRTYRAIKKELEKAFAQERDIIAHYIASPRIDSVVDQLKAHENKFVLLTTIGQLKNDHDETVMLDHAIALLSKINNHMLLTMEDSYMFPGVIGGYVTSGSQQGKNTGSMLIQYMQLSQVEDIPVNPVSPNEYLFDRQELHRAKLYLPAEVAYGATILNEDKSFYESQRTLILNSVGVLVFVLIAGLASMVIVTRGKNRIIEERTAELEQRAETLQDMQSSLSHAQKIAHLGNWEWNVDKNLMIVSDAVWEILEIEPSEGGIDFATAVNLIHEDDREQVVILLGRLKKAGDTINTHFKIVTAKRHEKTVHFYGHVLDQKQDGARIVGTIQDVTEQKNAEEHLEYMANYDPLTDLPNRNLLMQHMQRIISLAKRNHSRFALLFLDLDNFKFINDTLGHDKGDLLLVTVAQRLKSHIRESDMVVRMGGDEFVIVFENVKEPIELVSVCEKLIDLFNLPVELDGQEVFVTTSIGVSIYPDDGEEIVTLVKNADIAMYHSKEDGKNSFHFYTNEMNEKALVRLVLENNLRRAIDNHELELFYQPQVDMHSGEVVGAEALLRWNLKDVGYIQPDDFIGVAEEANLIIPIGTWVLNKLFEDMLEWEKAGAAPINCAMNVSSRQLIKGDFDRTVRNLSAEYGIDLKRLTVEITEGVLIETTEGTLGQLVRLQEMGVQISVDDFGTGYASLSYLKKLPIDKLKIDRSFVMDLEYNLDDQILTKTIITMAHNLGLDVIAEGVENAEQMRYLKAEGCRVVQGYYYAKPMPAEQFFELLNARTRLPAAEANTEES